MPGSAKTKSEGGTSTSSKRKRASEPKFYAVKNGIQPGVYHNWNDCKAQVTGFKNAIFKSFSTLTEAEHFVNGTSNSKSPSGSSNNKFYAVQSGRVPGVYTSWEDALQQITGWTRPKHKGFSTRAEAEAFVREGLSQGEAFPNVFIQTEPTDHSIKPSPSEAGQDAMAPKKRQKRSPVVEVPVATEDDPDSFNGHELGTGPLPPGTEDSFDNRIILDPNTGKLVKKTPEQLQARRKQPSNALSGPLKIYTDGSARGNGFAGAYAGVGVFFGPGDDRNVSEALQGPRQTNQRAELTAIHRAVELSPIDRDVIIYSDSNYAIQCVTVWFQNWRNNGWLTSAKKPVENRDLVELAINRIQERHTAGAKTEFVWVKGHANDEGNIAADRLAVNGAQQGVREAVEVAVDNEN